MTGHCEFVNYNWVLLRILPSTVVPNLFMFVYPYTVKKLTYPFVRWQGVFYGIF